MKKRLSCTKWFFHPSTECATHPPVSVLNEVPNSKIKEKQQDKLVVMNPTVKDDRQQQQSRDREMREAHSEKQNYSISKSRELKVYSLTICK